MLKTVLLLDGTKAMNSAVDYLPSRLLALRPCVQRFVSSSLELSPLSLLSAIVMRDGVAHPLCSLSNSATEVLDELELRYFLHGGSGTLSLERGLRAALAELMDGNTQREAALPSQLRVVVVSASLTLVDGGDIRPLAAMMARASVQVDVVHLCGAVHVLKELTDATCGGYHCAENFAQLSQILRHLSLYASPSRGREKRPRSVGDVPSSASASAGRWVDIGFPLPSRRESLSSAGGVSVTTAEHDGSVVDPTPRRSTAAVCPRCRLPQTTLPSVCPLCGLLVGCLVYAHLNYVWRNALVPDSLQVASRSDYGSTTDCSGGQPLLGAARCELCDENLTTEGVGASGAKTTVQHVVCRGCNKARCRRCDALVREGIGICPSCVA